MISSTKAGEVRLDLGQAEFERWRGRGGELTHRIFVPRLMDASNLNAQNKNAQAILRTWCSADARPVTLAYAEADAGVAGNPEVEIVKLWRGRSWRARFFLSYLQRYDLIFYPGTEPTDLAGLRWRRRIGHSRPVVATFEGLAGDVQREGEYSRVAGHPVYCHRVPDRVLRRVDELHRQASHIIAISPFLARLGAARHGDKFSVLPLGVDTTIFHSPVTRRAHRQLSVVSAGRVGVHKRPRVFVELAARFPDVRFQWYGDGDDRVGLIAEAGSRRLSNLEFPGPKSPADLAEAFRRADIFLLPSLSEGVPKVTLEAAACGLPVVAFGFYEPPSVVDGKTGFLVWSDQEMEARLGQLIEDSSLREKLGAGGLELARGCDWKDVAPLWEDRVVELARRGGAR